MTLNDLPPQTSYDSVVNQLLMTLVQFTTGNNQTFKRNTLRNHATDVLLEICHEATKMFPMKYQPNKSVVPSFLTFLDDCQNYRGFGLLLDIVFSFLAKRNKQKTRIVASISTISKIPWETKLEQITKYLCCCQESLPDEVKDEIDNENDENNVNDVDAVNAIPKILKVKENTNQTVYNLITILFHYYNLTSIFDPGRIILRGTNQILDKLKMIYHQTEHQNLFPIEQTSERKHESKQEQKQIENIIDLFDIQSDDDADWLI
jgi:hypothetical protein